MSKHTDPLTSFHFRTTQFLASLNANGRTAAAFGCSDFYPQPTSLPQLTEDPSDDESYRGDSGSEDCDNSAAEEQPSPHKRSLTKKKATTKTTTEPTTKKKATTKTPAPRKRLPLQQAKVSPETSQVDSQEEYSSEDEHLGSAF